MRSSVDEAINIHNTETGHDVQFKEEWSCEFCAFSESAKYRVVLRGATRFEAAHAVIEQPDGSRWLQSLGPRVPQGITDEQLQHRTWSFPIGKPKCIQKRASEPGGSRK
jgi:hypothetical protein